jgi:predicted DNA-binding transcriptional regulator AlpA
MKTTPAADTEKQILQVIRKGAGQGGKLSRGQQEAIAALLSQRNVEEAARVAGRSPATLYRWLKDPDFKAAYRQARTAGAEQATARLQKASGAAVTILLRVMYDLSAPRAVRLKAADRVLSCMKGTSRMEEVGARLWALKHGRQALKPALLDKDRRASPADQRGRPRKPGHGAKFDRKKEEAITALLTRRSVEEAASAVGIGTTTLYTWIQEAEFAAAYREARLTAFGQAGMRLQQASGPAATTILTIMVEPAASASAQVMACGLVLKHAKGAGEEDIELWLAEARRARQAASADLTGARRTFAETVRVPPGFAA